MVDIKEVHSPLQKEAQTATLIKAVLAGKTVNSRVGDWEINNPNSPNLVRFFYFSPGENISTGLLAFEIKGVQDQGPIIFENYDREFEYGYGTFGLKSFERSLKIVVKDLMRPIQVVFPASGQEDTSAWLELNSYKQTVPETDLDRRVYSKIIR